MDELKMNLEKKGCKDFQTMLIYYSVSTRAFRVLKNRLKYNSNKWR